MYVPNPLRCFRCQRYGHHISKCPNEETCSKCAHQGPDHDSSTCSNPLHRINCKSANSTFSRECPAWREEKEVLSIKYNNNVSFPDARKLFEQRKKTSYAGVFGSSPEKDDCNTCKILAKILLQKFPDVATELKELLPASTLSKLIPDSSSAPKTNKPSSAQSKPTNPQSTSSQKTSKPSTSSQNILHKKLQNHPPLHNRNLKLHPHSLLLKFHEKKIILIHQNLQKDPLLGLNHNLEMHPDRAKQQSKKMILSLLQHIFGARGHGCRC